MFRAENRLERKMNALIYIGILLIIGLAWNTWRNIEDDGFNKAIVHEGKRIDTNRLLLNLNMQAGDSGVKNKDSILQNIKSLREALKK